MSAKGSFENEYSANISDTIINDTKKAISNKFSSKLHNFKTTKLQMLTTTMEKEIFYDGTVYTGSAGLAMYYLMTYLKNDGSYEVLKIALEYIDLDKLKGRRLSFLCGDAGPLALATVISYKFGNKRPDNLPDYKNLAQRLMGLITLLNDSPDELLFGKTGYLYALLFVNKYISGKELIPSDHVEKVISSILKSGKQLSSQMSSESPLLWQWHEKVYFGAAHGMAGILYMLLQARIYVNITDLRSFIKPTLDWLLNQRFESNNFPSSMNSSNGDKLVQWCHGAPGFVALWGLAYQKPIHLYRACCFMEWCAVERPGTELHRPDRPASLFEGLLGRIYLADDLTHVLDAKFPAFTV